MTEATMSRLLAALIVVAAARAGAEDLAFEPVEPAERRGPYASQPTSVSALPMMSAAEAAARAAAQAAQPQAAQPMTAGGQFFGMAINKGADSLYDPPGDD